MTTEDGISLPHGASGAPGRGRVLVVEDEETVRRFAAESLVDAGFEILEAADADEAIRILEMRADVDVMVSDVRMPGATNGYRLAQRVRERWPFVEIILVSGYAAPDRRDIAFDCDILVKPYEAEDLVRCVTQRARRAAR